MNIDEILEEIEYAIENNNDVSIDTGNVVLVIEPNDDCLKIVVESVSNKTYRDKYYVSYLDDIDGYVVDGCDIYEIEEILNDIKSFEEEL